MNDDKSWIDERIKLGEIPSHFAAQAAARSAQPGFAENAAKLTESDRQILSELPPDRFAAEVRRRAGSAKRIDEARRQAPSRAAWGSAVMAACLALAFVVVHDPGAPATPGAAPSVASAVEPAGMPSGSGTEPAPLASTESVSKPSLESERPSPDWRTKGGVELTLQRESPEGPKTVTDSDTLSAGTRLRLSVPASLAWAAVYSIDSHGEMAQHWPLQGDKAQALAQGPLPRAWELDATAGHETFVLVWSDKPFGLEAVRKAIFLHRDAPRLPKGIRTFVAKVRKASGTPK